MENRELDTDDNDGVVLGNFDIDDNGVEMEDFDIDDNGEREIMDL